MLDNNGFDLWSDEYDKTVGVSDSDNTYPFAGYKEVLDRIFKTVTSTPNAVILDIGLGTGVLSAKLYALGYEIWGQDFSQNMLDKAKSKMPDAHLYLGDFANGLDSEILHNKYDYIVATPFKRRGQNQTYQSIANVVKTRRKNPNRRRCIRNDRKTKRVQNKSGRRMGRRRILYRFR